MTTLNFADTRNMVAFLSNPAESDGFEQIVGHFESVFGYFSSFLKVKARVESSGDEESLDDADNNMFDGSEEMFVAGQNENVVKEIVNVAQVSTAATTVTITIEEITLAQALEALKTSKPKDKGKGIMIEEPVKPMKKKNLIRLDEEIVKKLQAKCDEEERLAGEKAEKEERDSIALIEELDDIQAKIDVDHQLVERLQAQEKEELALKWVNAFEDFRIELVEGKEKRAGEEVTIDAISLAVKSPRIVDWKIHKEGKKSYYQIIRADGKSQMYMVFSHMLKSFDREDFKDLYKLVKARYGSTRPVESMDYLLWNDMKIMFEPYVEDEVWKLQQGYKVLEWKLYDSCGVHSLRMKHSYVGR
ncbi:hypothetical protein Tco_0596741 [Tanacetum coccineum]